MLSIIGRGRNVSVEHTEPALPAAVPVPSKRDALEALGHVQAMVRGKNRSMLVDGEVINISDEFEILRRFVLTR